jgi:hypothetical protein
VSQSNCSFSYFSNVYRDLSHGDFTPDNQKRLEGFRDLNADIYSAWITGDTRLIYCIDCVEDVDSQVSDDMHVLGYCPNIVHYSKGLKFKVRFPG